MSNIKTLDDGRNALESDEGINIIDYIDFFDETQFGAGNLRLRERCATLDEVKTLAADAVGKLNDESAVCNMNRLAGHSNNYLLRPVDAKCPNKARYRFEMLLRIHFYNDFGYVHIGVPWTDENTPDTPEAGLISVDTSDVKVIKTCWLSAENAKAIAEYILS